MNRSFAAVALAVAAAAPTSSCNRQGAGLFAAGVFESTEVIVAAEATGRLLSFDVLEGQQLTAGVPVGEVDCKQIALQRDLTATQRRDLRNKFNDLATQTAPLKEQVASTEIEFNRIKALLARGAATQREYDNVDAQLKLTRRQLAATTQTLTLANQVLTDTSAQMGLQLDTLDDQLRKCTLRPPADGTVLAKYTQAGEFVSPGKALYKLADVRRMFLRAYVTADQLTQLKLGQEVPVRADFGAKGRRDYRGRVAWIADSSEFTPKTIETRDERANLVYAVKVAVDNDGYLKIGMYGEIPLSSEAPRGGNPVARNP